MGKYKHFLTNSKDIQKSSYIWNTIAGLLFALQSALLLMVIPRTNGLEDAGVFSIAYAIASLMSFIGEWGVRKYQVSDIGEDVSFQEYYALRLLTCAAMMVAGILYAGYGLIFGTYSFRKFLIIVCMVVVKLVETYADVFYGLFQQRQRLDIASKTTCLRTLAGIIGCILCLVLTHDLLISIIGWIIISVFGYCATTIPCTRGYVAVRPVFNWPNIRKVTVACFPLFLGSFLLIYIGNAGKYAIDYNMNEVAQAQYNFIFMPVFVVNMLASFVYNPIMVSMAYDWTGGRFGEFKSTVVKQSMAIGVMTAMAVTVALTIGCPVLGIMFGTDLSEFKGELCVLMIGSGMLALVNFFSVVITIIRFQKYLMIGYLSASLIALLMSGTFVKNHGIMGASVLYTVLMSLLAVIFLITTIVCICKGKSYLTEGE